MTFLRFTIEAGLTGQPHDWAFLITMNNFNIESLPVIHGLITFRTNVV